MRLSPGCPRPGTARLLVERNRQRKRRRNAGCRAWGDGLELLEHRRPGRRAAPAENGQSLRRLVDSALPGLAEWEFAPIPLLRPSIAVLRGSAPSAPPQLLSRRVRGGY